MAARLGGEPGSGPRLESSRHGYFRPFYNHRLRLVESVGNAASKPTARLFATSTLTVRKWWRRYPQHGPSGLQEHSRAPHRHPRKTAAHLEQQVVTLRKKLPTFGAARLRREFLGIGADFDS